MNNISTNYFELKEQIQKICQQNNINYPIELIAVSKTFPTENIITLHKLTHQIAFGENYVQELNEKASYLVEYNLKWHFIGNIQSNKIKQIAKWASWVHSLGSIHHAELLNKSRSSELPKLNVLIEVNVSGDATKHGLTDFMQILGLAEKICQQSNLVLRGLMGMTGANADLNTKNQQFGELRQLFNKLKSTPGFENIDTLSMGMSDDFELAIKNGANMLRIGSKIFGSRK
ncbi:MAG: YggS family pyridoxal phosphate-dependent enzyme [Burkholderiales bacterium]|jgi:pyridoxal phosphate enzyme (YggS family)|nr:YggS family pyridoxal phosphate-dependent enzyme [Burkholderiales bacterium]